MSYIEVRATGDSKKDKSALDMALKEFKRQVKKSGILSEMRRREAYMSPSKYKKFRKEESIRRRKREQRKDDWSHKNNVEW